MSDARPLLAGRYRLVRQLGQGGMGRIWLAVDETLHRDVAVKEIVPPPGLTEADLAELRPRTLREARSAARLNHPNVVRIYDVLTTETYPWIVMEYVEGRSLDEIVHAEGPLSPAQTAEIGLGVLGALVAAHSAGILHRDVKPANILITATGRVVLTDFGLATIAGDPAVTRSGVIIGSPAFMAPERVRDGVGGEESDLWSLGTTLYFAVEGRSPYLRASTVATIAAIATEDPPPARRAGKLRPTLNGLLRREPRDRLTAPAAERMLRKVAGTSRLPRVSAALAAAVAATPTSPANPPRRANSPHPAAPPPAVPPVPPGTVSPTKIDPAIRPAPAVVAPTTGPPTRPGAPDQAGTPANGDSPATTDEPNSSAAASAGPEASADLAVSDAVSDHSAGSDDAGSDDAASDGTGGSDDAAGREDAASDDAGPADDASGVAASGVAASGVAASGEAAASEVPVVATGEPPAEPAAELDEPVTNSEPGEPAAEPATSAESAVRDNEPANAAPAAPPTSPAPAVAKPTSSGSPIRPTVSPLAKPRVTAAPATSGPATPGPRTPVGQVSPGPAGSPPVVVGRSPVPSRVSAPTSGDATALGGPPRPVDQATVLRRTAAGVVALVVLTALVALLLNMRDGDSHATGGKTGSPAAARTDAQRTQAPASGSGASSEPAATSAVPSQTAADVRLPAGWRRYTDRTGFSVAVPAAWAVSREGTMVYFRERGGDSRVLGIDQTNQPKSNPVADWTAQAAHRVANGDFPGYREVRIVAVDYFLKAADWEFTYNDGGRVHAVNRGFVTGKHKAYGMWWSTPDATWAKHLPELELIRASFRPAKN